ncbi:MAG: hypothetical protein HY720_27035 [Planctomycetes bacterium]|nr:hypothetical protein [Planctomycetota bacterium]
MTRSLAGALSLAAAVRIATRAAGQERYRFDGEAPRKPGGSKYAFTLRVHNDTEESRDPVE